MSNDKHTNNTDINLKEDLYMQYSIAVDYDTPSEIKDCYVKFLVAILERAYLDCFLKSKRRQREAAAYIFSDNTEEFSIVWVVKALNKPGLLQKIRDKVKHLR